MSSLSIPQRDTEIQQMYFELAQPDGHTSFHVPEGSDHQQRGGSTAKQEGKTNASINFSALPGQMISNWGKIGNKIFPQLLKPWLTKATQRKTLLNLNSSASTWSYPWHSTCADQTSEKQREIIPHSCCLQMIIAKKSVTNPVPVKMTECSFDLMTLKDIKWYKLGNFIFQRQNHHKFGSSI